MYEQFYNLSSRPFDTIPDEKFVWLGEQHKEVLAALRYGVIDNKGLLLLTGELGTGKSTLINSLVRNLTDDVEWAIITDPALDRIDFYNAVAVGFSLEKNFTSKVQFLIQFSYYLNKVHDDGKKVVLIIDNCQGLTQEMLEELRLLSNIEKDETKLINILFCGQTEFNDMLALPKNRTVRQRMTLNMELPPLSMDETDEYIKYRLSVVGAPEKLFSNKAVNLIHRISRGILRNINILCAYSMMAGAVRGKKAIDHRLVGECLAKLGLPTHPANGDLAALSTDHCSLEKFQEKFVATGIIGYDFGKKNRNSLLQYGVLATALVAFGAYFWWPQSNEVKIEDISASTATDPAAVVENSERVETEASIPKEVVLKPPKKELVEDTAAVAKVDFEEAELHDVPEVVISDEAEVHVEARTESAHKERTVVAQAETAATPEKDVKAETELAVAKPFIEGEKFILPLHANSIKLTDEGWRNLKKMKDALANYPNAHLLVKGYVSSRNNSPENIKLSEERAALVRKFLVEEGFAENQMEIKGMGNQEPLASNDTWEGRSKNRRVEVVVLDDGN